MTDSKDNGKNSGSEPERPGNKDFSDLAGEIIKLYPGGKQAIAKMLFGAVSTVSKIASKATGVSDMVGKTLSPPSQDQGKAGRAMQEAGEYLKDLREVAGLTLKDLSDAAKLPDQSLLAAVENGTATLSFELILRLAALLARHDPVPFIIRLTRTYNPDLWSVMKNWGLGRLPLQFEREREFINIYRSHDAARKLSDEEFQRVLEFTRSAFEMALLFAAEKDSGKEGKG